MSIFTDDTPKKLIFYNGATDITEYVILNTFSGEDILNENYLNFGECNPTRVQFDMIQDLSLTGSVITVSFGADSTYEVVGNYKVTYTSSIENSDKVRLTAYDVIKVADVDVSDWYNGLTFPTTVLAMRNSLCSYLGITQESVTLPNDSAPLYETIAPSSLNGKDVLRAIGELNACYPHDSKNYTLDWIFLGTVATTIDSSLLYGSDSYVKNDFVIATINKLIIRQQDDDIGAIIGVGTNAYTITGNFLIYGNSASELEDIGNNIYSIINAVSYTPSEIIMKYQPTLNMGDLISYNGNEFYIFNRNLSGLLYDDIICDGDEYQEENKSINTQIEQLRGKTNVLTITIEETQSTITDLEENLQTQITQNAEEIDLRVTYGDVINSINISTEGITIDSDNVNIEGVVTVINAGGSTTQITGSGIATNTVTANNLAVGLGGNLYINYDSFENTPSVPYYALTSTIAFSYIESGAYYGKRMIALVTNSSHTTGSIHLGTAFTNYGCIPVQSGKTYRISAYFKASSSFDMQLGLIGHSTPDTSTTVIGFADATIYSGSWQRVEFGYAADGSYPYVSIRIKCETPSKTLWCDAIQIEEVKSTTTLASPFKPSSVTYVNGGNILTQTITANKLSVTELSSITANIGDITAGNITTTSSAWLDPEVEDLNVLKAYIQGTGTLTAAQLVAFDFNNDGTVDLFDYSYCRALIVGTYTIDDYVTDFGYVKTLSTVTVYVQPSSPDNAVRISSTNSFERVINKYVGASNSLLGTLRGNTTVSGGLFVGNGIYIDNNTSIYGTRTDGDYTALALINSSNDIAYDYATENAHTTRIGTTGYTTNMYLRTSGTVQVQGNFTVSGSKSREVETSQGKVLLGAYETPVPHFGDIGSGEIIENGYIEIPIEEIFLETIEVEDLKIQITPTNSPTEFYWVEKTENSFIVHGNNGLAFDWEIKAPQSGYNYRYGTFDINQSEETEVTNSDTSDTI